jgi:hypothetical protein
MVNDELVKELIELRSGRGLYSPDLLRRLGPGIRSYCRITAGQDEASIRRAVLERLESATDELPEDLSLAARAALAIPPAPRAPFLRDRWDWLADRLERDVRTVARRADDAFQLLAERLAAGPPRQEPPDSPFAPDGWYIEDLVSNVLIDRDPAQLVETRRIVALEPGLEEISISFSVPRSGDVAGDRPLSVSILHGGELVTETGSMSSHYRGRLRLPRPLSVGESHEYGVVFSAFSRQWIRPYYVLTPLRRCDHFLLRAKFDRMTPPVKVWRLDGVPARVVDEFTPTDDLLDPDAVCEVRAEFHALRQGLSYGIQWTSSI